MTPVGPATEAGAPVVPAAPTTAAERLEYLVRLATEARSDRAADAAARGGDVTAPVEPGDAGMLAIVTQLAVLIADAHAGVEPSEAARIARALTWRGADDGITRAEYAAECAILSSQCMRGGQQERAWRMLAAYLMALDAIDPAPRLHEGPGAEVGP